MEQRDFFISYTKADRAEADWIAETLIRHGYSVYIQTRDIAPADSFVEKMEEFLDNSRSFIAVWSKNYSRSKFAMWEFRAAFAACQRGLMETLIPVCVEDHPLPRLYAHLVHADLFGVGEAEKTRRLLDAVGYRGTARKAQTAEELNQIGDNYSSGRNGVEQDYTKAREYYEQAAAKGNADALTNLGNLYWNGSGVDVDYTKAREYYKQAAEKGNATALYNLGVLYDNGIVVKQDYTKARKYYEQAAERGNASALNNLGFLYRNGLGVDVDYAKARVYYEQAAEKGIASALNNLGFLYDFGQGVDRDYTKAREYYEQAAAKGSAMSLSNLGFFYEYGRGVAMNYDKAESYYQQAIEKGDKDTHVDLRRLREKMKNT